MKQSIGPAGFQLDARAVKAASRYATRKLEHYYLYHASRADLLRRLHRKEDATTAYNRALALATNQVEQQYLRRRLREVLETNGHSS
ncbi:MAG TPA: hypothetical protein VF088_20285 [Pyrinomonadaceae bacterium]